MGLRLSPDSVSPPNELFQRADPTKRIEGDQYYLWGPAGVNDRKLRTIKRGARLEIEEDEPVKEEEQDIHAEEETRIKNEPSDEPDGETSEDGSEEDSEDGPSDEPDGENSEDDSKEDSEDERGEDELPASIGDGNGEPEIPDGSQLPSGGRICIACGFHRPKEYFFEKEKVCYTCSKSRCIDCGCVMPPEEFEGVSGVCGFCESRRRECNVCHERLNEEDFEHVSFLTCMACTDRTFGNMGL